MRAGRPLPQNVLKVCAHIGIVTLRDSLGAYSGIVRSGQGVTARARCMALVASLALVAAGCGRAAARPVALVPGTPTVNLLPNPSFERRGDQAGLAVGWVQWGASQ